jgi:glucosyl-3-phosphoglycerate synthase
MTRWLRQARRGIQAWRGWLRQRAVIARWLLLGIRPDAVPPANARPHADPAEPAEPVSRPPAPLRLPLAASVSVVIPALNEEVHVADVVAFALGDRLTAEVIVIDDSSLDDTVVRARGAGARVVTSSLLGKGASMQDGVHEAAHEIVVYLDGDLSGLQPGLISALCEPLLADRADFVKARFGRSGGRVTELTAKPMLKVFFPELAHFGQPLGGIIAARRTLLRQLDIEPDYGADIGLLIDAFRSGARLAEVDIGSLVNDSQPLQDLSAMANEVARVIYARARAAGRLHADQVLAMFEAQRQAAASLAYILSRRRGQLRLLLLSQDALIAGPDFLAALGQATGQAQAITQALSTRDDEQRGVELALLMRFVHKQQLDRVARALPLRPGVVELVNRMRRCGFMVGVLSDTWFGPAEIVRRRVFADFALGHSLVFDGDTCTGQVRFNPAYRPVEGAGERADADADADANGSGPALCKSHVLRRLQADRDAAPLLACWALGSTPQDLPLLRLAEPGFAIEPLTDAVRQEPGLRLLTSIDELLALVPAPLARDAAAPAAQDGGQSR